MNAIRQGRQRRHDPPRWVPAIALAAALALGGTGCAGAGASSHGADASPLQAFQIRTVQRELSLRGLHVEPTGELDEPTRAALARYQASKGLPSTGRLDWATAQELGVNLDPMYNCEMNNTVDCGPPGSP